MNSIRAQGIRHACLDDDQGQTAPLPNDADTTTKQAWSSFSEHTIGREQHHGCCAWRERQEKEESGRRRSGMGRSECHLRTSEAVRQRFYKQKNMEAAYGGME
ncbi:hypothetical protein Naga_101656g2 [Nannochloropsis gaditana]|uniref:Uncharacterized protein n=1 Tax=Nannochloropsis gaditana TaxID=72520 RepID=W7TA74_9STRA|nr:hypothetical protein Naga_101656g2 [Nannochloropsis gaditana]